MSSSSRPLKVKDLCNSSSDDERYGFSNSTRVDGRATTEKKSRRGTASDQRMKSSSPGNGNSSQLSAIDSISVAKLEHEHKLHHPSTSRFLPTDTMASKKVISDDNKLGIRKEKDYLCERCGRLFKRKGDVEKHIRVVHEKVKDFVCTICGRPFGRKDYLIVSNFVQNTFENFKMCGANFFLLKEASAFYTWHKTCSFWWKVQVARHLTAKLQIPVITIL